MISRKVHKEAIEQLCVLMIDGGLRDIGRSARYRGPNEPLDFEVVDRLGSRIGVGEITADRDPKAAEFQSLGLDHKRTIPLPPDSGRWMAMVNRPVDLSAMSGTVQRLLPLARLSQRGAGLSPYDQWEIDQVLDADGLESLSFLDSKADEVRVMGPMFGGVIDEDAELLARYTSEAVERPVVARHVQKLCASDLQERHLVLIPDRPVEHYSVSWRMNDWGYWPGLPTTAPTLPEKVADLWLVQPGIGHTVHWSRTLGWDREGPLGNDWWHPYADTPELFALKEWSAK